VIVSSSEDNLQQLHEIHESIQQMCEQTTVQTLNSQVSAGTEVSTNVALLHDLATAVNFTLFLIFSRFTSIKSHV
jgi:hypothetical protein